ncbi:MAG TPA: hypothetical protein VNB90_09435 [Cytophagaceae bacterium]|jgi:hypothetical protein|nr:hypothetical protein [Cytophagaceae bacterium]
MNKIIDFINHLECPSVDGIIFPDETVQLLSVKVDWGLPINYTINMASKTSIKILNDKGELHWNSCAILVRLINQKYSIEIIAGEGDYGSDGFVGIMDFATKKMIWIAFFNNSNPFEEVKVIDEEIYAKSTLGCIWRFKIKNPIDCIVECR